MNVLDKLRMSSETAEDYAEESREESEEEYGDGSPEEFNPNFDPSPGQAPTKPAPRNAKTRLSQVRDLGGPRVTKKMKDDAQTEIQSIVEVLALAWGWQAPPCGDALEEAAPEFSAKLIKIVARNPRWLQRVRDGGLIADIIGMFGTLAPVAKVAYAHYSAPREDNDANGVTFDPSQFQPYDGTGFSRAG